jgi:hypothetical protein
MTITTDFNIAQMVVSLFTGGIGAAVVGTFLNRRLTAILDVWRSRRTWEERSVAELLGPVFIQLDRTKRAFERWEKQNLFLEAEVVREANLAIRDLLLGKPHLIPPTLRKAASELILHYDVWLEEFDRLRAEQSSGKGRVDFVFVGPKGFPFPTKADEAFTHAFEEAWKRLYASDT